MEPKEPNCVICIYDDGYEVAGPFASYDAACEYGRKWQEENGDDPRWNTVYLEDPDAPVNRVRPTPSTDWTPGDVLQSVSRVNR
jgi:hypothetical protein